MIRPPDEFVSACKNIFLSASEKSACKQNLMKRVTGAETARQSVGMNFNEFQASAKAIALAPHEKMHLKEALRASMKHAPQSPVFFARFLRLSPFKNFTSVMAAFLIVTLSGAAVSYAAEDAIPGDLLYPIKVGVNEQMRVALATDPLIRARLQHHFAERRMREAETLAVKARLDARLEQQIALRFKGHVQAIREAAATLPESERLVLQHQLASSLETSVKAHIALLNSVHGVDAYTDSTAQIRVMNIDIPSATTDSLEAVLRSEARIVEAERVNLEFAMETKGVFEENLAEAVHTLASIESQFLQAKDRLPDVTKEFIERRVAMAKIGIKEAQDTASGAQDEKRNQTTRTTLRALKEAEISLTMQPTSFKNKGKNSLSVEAQVQAERQEDNAALANAKISIIRNKINKIHNAVSSQSSSEGTTPDPALLPVEARITGAEQLIDIANEQINAGNADAALDAVESARKHTDVADDEAKTILQKSSSASASASAVITVPAVNLPTSSAPASTPTLAPPAVVPPVVLPPVAAPPVVVPPAAIPPVTIPQAPIVPGI